MIYNIKLHFSNKFLCDRIVKYSIIRIHVCNWTYMESNTSMHGIKYTVKSTCARISVLNDSFVMCPRFCVIVQKSQKCIEERRHAERIEIFSSTIAVDVDCHPIFSWFVVWVRIADVQWCTLLVPQLAIHCESIPLEKSLLFSHRTLRYAWSLVRSCLFNTIIKHLSVAINFQDVLKYGVYEEVDSLCIRYNEPCCRSGASQLCSKMRHGSCQFYRERNESRVCIKSDDVPSTRHVTIIHPVGKKFFDKIGYFLFQLYVKTALKIDSQSEESHNSTPMYYAVVKDFSGDSSVNCFRVVIYSDHTDIDERF